MEERKASALINLSRMVHNLEFMCLKEQEKISQKSYTNFSMHEILKPSFGLTSNYDYDSDSAYTSDNWDASSSSDEALDRLSVRSQSPEEAITYSVIQSQRVRKNGCTTAPRATVKPKNELMTSWTQRWRQKFEDDGYSSSDSESALDLRIERKKTPPKLTSQIPAWVFCTRYSDRPSAGPRSRRRRTSHQRQQRRARTAFSDKQIAALNIEFDRDQYLSESRRHDLAEKVGIDEASVKIWFQNKRAKLKKDAVPHPLALELQAQGLYNHKMIPKASE